MNEEEWRGMKKNEETRRESENGKNKMDHNEKRWSQRENEKRIYLSSENTYSQTSYHHHQ